MNLLFNSLELDNFGSYAGTGHRIELISSGSLVYITGVNKAQPSLASNDLGKALDDSLIIDTPNGKRAWGSLRVGDYVFGRDGKPTQITGFFPQGIQKLYKVSFNDGSFTITSEDHLWCVKGYKIHSDTPITSCSRKRDTYILSTKEILRRGIKVNNGSAYKNRQWEIPRNGPVVYPEQKLAIDPYVLGMWLGNGSASKTYSTRISVNSCDKDVISKLESSGFEIGTHIIKPGCIEVSLHSLGRALRDLKLLNLHSHERFIPKLYLYSSVEQRLELLKGLLDSDAECSKAGVVVFTSTSKKLVDQVIWLCRSLGGHAKLGNTRIGKYKKPDGTLQICRESFRATLTNDTYLFFSERKKSRQNINIASRRLARWIDDIKPCGEGSCSCITVAAGDRLFLANDFIVTHNSTLINALYWVLTGKTLRSARPGGAVECWSTSDPVRVALHFAKNGIDHVLVRERRPNNLTLDGQIVSNEKILMLIGLSEEAIKHTIIIGQFNDFFLDLRPEQQSQLFAELLNLQIYEDAASKASQQTRQLDRKITELEKSSSEAHGRITEITEQISSITIKKDEFEAEKAANLIKYKTEKSHLKNSISNLKEDLDKIIQDDKGLPDISAQEQDIKELSKSMGDLDSSVATLGINLAKNHKELQLVEAQLSTYRSTQNICPECGQEVDKDHIAEKIEGYSIRRRKLLDTIESEELVKKKRQRRRDAIMEEVQNISDSIQESRGIIESSKEIRTDVTIKLNQLWEDKKYLTQKIEDLTNSKNPHEDSLWELHDRKRVLRQRQRELAITKADTEKTLAIYEIWAKAFKEIRLNLIDDTLLELEFTVNKHIAALGLHNWEVGFETERETAKGNLVSKMTVNIFPPDRNDPVSLDALGGGVTTRIQLGIFFGLSEILLARAGVLPNIEVLDEPSRHLSEEGLDDLLEALKERAVNSGRSIYFVDHQSLDSGLFDRTIYIEKNEEGSRIVSQ